MCGITAISRVNGSSSIHSPEHFMKLALLAIERRGTDATGVAWSQQHETPTGRFFYWKQPRKASLAIADVDLPMDVITSIGHTRAATQGDKSQAENNHPVVDDGIMLVHNGIVYNDFSLYREHFGTDYVPKAEVDSQVIASLLAHRRTLGFNHPTEILSQIRGSAAVAWIETDDVDTLHLSRVIERPLTIAWTRKGDLVMSSAPETLRALADTARLKLRRTEEVPEGTYLRIVRGEIVERTEFKPDRQKWSHPTYTATTRNGVTVVKPTTTTNVKPNEDWSAFDKRVKADADARRKEIDEFWARHPDEIEADIEEMYQLRPVDQYEDDPVFEPDGTIVEMFDHRPHPGFDLPRFAWMKGDRFYRYFRFPVDFDPTGYERDFWDGLELYSKFTIDLAYALNTVAPSDDEVLDTFIEMYQAEVDNFALSSLDNPIHTEV